MQIGLAVPPIILVALLLVTVVVMPVWPHSRGWGWSIFGMVAIMLGVGTLVAVSGGQL